MDLNDPFEYHCKDFAFLSEVQSSEKCLHAKLSRFTLIVCNQYFRKLLYDFRPVHRLLKRGCDCWVFCRWVGGGGGGGECKSYKNLDLGPLLGVSIWFLVKNFTNCE